MVLWENFTHGPIKILGEGTDTNMIQIWLSLYGVGGPELVIRNVTTFQS